MAKKYIDAEKLKRLVGELKERAERNRCDSWGIVPDALEEVEGFIASLQQEQSEVDLEKEVENFRKDALLEWAKEKQEQMKIEAGGCSNMLAAGKYLAYSELIEKIELL